MGIFDIIYEGSTMRERRELDVLLEDANVQQSVATNLITKLYQSAIDKRHVDFEDLPNTRGDITKYSGFKTLTETHEVLRQLSTEQGVRVEELAIVEEALRNIVGRKKLYEDSFNLDNEIGILSYLTMSYAVVAATSSIISNYVEFIRTPDLLEFKMRRNPKDPAPILIKNLQLFNTSVRKGEYNSTINSIPREATKNNFTGSAIIFPALVITGLMTIVPVSREIIFYFYYSRMKLSEYMEQQASLLELNKAAVESSNRVQKEKKDIISRQKKVADRFHKISDLVKVHDTAADKGAKHELKTQNKSWSVKDVKPNAIEDTINSTTAAPTKQDGFTLF